MGFNIRAAANRVLRGVTYFHRTAAWKFAVRRVTDIGWFVGAILQRWLPMSTGVLLVFIGHRLTVDGEEHAGSLWDVTGLLSSELGYAFIVAPLLFVFFEQWAARHHCKSAIGLLYGVRPEGPMFDKIEEYVLKQKFYRTKVVVTYAFEECIDEAVRVCVSIRYSVKNVCSNYREADFPLKGRVEMKPLHMTATPFDSNLGLMSLSLDGEAVPGDRIKTCTEGDRVMKWEARDTPSIPYDHIRRVEASFCVVKHDHDSAVWSTTVPCDGVELHVRWAEGVKLKFVFSPTHPELDDIDPAPGDHCQVVRCDTPFLKGHGIHFQWAPA